MQKWDKKVKTAIKQSADIDMSTKDRIGVNLAKKLANGQREARKAEAVSSSRCMQRNGTMDGAATFCIGLFRMSSNR